MIEQNQETPDTGSIFLSVDIGHQDKGKYQAFSDS